ncbi:MAG: cob(I)yrinic acid a,c-diamide adenosyltransferase [Treponema sp.]|nr:cob(I)yrinic acid a,c-diamide adenosyltransferase [Treponema sp.]MCL2252265.1 cob(I)yrinic acid a,c-diamide adenosyltransferase [Treponema sp.]
MKIYTKQGDAGETFDLNGKKLFKDDPLFHFIGTVDELNCYLGLIKAMLSNEDAWQYEWKSSCSFLEKTQRRLNKIMADVCGNKSPSEITSADIASLEKEIDRLSGNIPKTKEFTLPGYDIIEAHIHIARTVARRAERMFYEMKNTRNLCPQISAYLNRLSDYLFVLSCQESLINVNFINQITGV